MSQMDANEQLIKGHQNQISSEFSDRQKNDFKIKYSGHHHYIQIYMSGLYFQNYSYFVPNPEAQMLTHRFGNYTPQYCPLFNSQALFPGSHPFNSQIMSHRVETHRNHFQLNFPQKVDQQVQCNLEQLKGYFYEYDHLQNKKPQIKEEEKEDSLQDDEYSYKKKRLRKLPETKNLMKNYGRSILAFIQNSNDYRRKVLRKLNIPDHQFHKVIIEFRNQIHTISGSRYLWQSHPYSKAFRIMGCEYLRKHNLQHIFNSRISKKGVYLKYQKKMMRCLQQPQQFESIKDF